ncbi:hypothetical protein C8R47DRAFT_1078745 [Mycena vitilis]|nr:hypothetical protein C8R47DRAFT_1078745 [Mycena vitilis]
MGRRKRKKIPVTQPAASWHKTSIAHRRPRAPRTVQEVCATRSVSKIRDVGERDEASGSSSDREEEEGSDSGSTTSSMSDRRREADRRREESLFNASYDNRRRVHEMVVSEFASCISWRLSKRQFGMPRRGEDRGWDAFYNDTYREDETSEEEAIDSNEEEDIFVKEEEMDDSEKLLDPKVEETEVKLEDAAVKLEDMWVKLEVKEEDDDAKL